MKNRTKRRDAARQHKANQHDEPRWRRDLNFYKHHLGDYDGATAHLSWDEDMAYTRLLRAYYRREKAIEVGDVYRLVRASSRAQRAAVDVVLKEFFDRREDGWHNRRADEEIAAYQAQSDTNKRIARTRWQNEPYTNRIRTVYEPSTNTEQERTPNQNQNQNQEPRKRKDKGRAFALPVWLPAEQWDAWLEVRKRLKAPNTDRALSLAVADLERLKADGQDPAAVLDQATKRGWRGLFPLANGGSAPDYSSLMKEPDATH